MARQRVRFFTLIGFIMVLSLACGRSVDGRGADPTPAPGPDALSVVIEVTDPAGVASLALVFSARIEGGRAPYHYSWLFGDGGWSVEPSPAYTYEDPGNFAAYVLITDADGTLADTTREVSVGSIPPLAANVVITSFELREIHLDDVFEPNDQVGTYVGAAPMYSQLYAYLDTRTLELTAAVTNQGETDAEPFGVEIFENLDDAPAPGRVADLTHSVETLASGETTQATFTIENAEGRHWSTWLRVGTQLETQEVDATEDVDRFRFYQDAGYPINVTLDLLPSDYDVVLFTPSGSYVGSYNGGTYHEHISITAPYSGFYTVMIYSFEGRGDSDDFYRLTLDLR